MEDEKKKEYKWYLRWSGMKDTEVNRRKAAYCKVVTLAKDSQCHLINYDEYQEMIKKEEIAPPLDSEGGFTFWQIEEGEIGLINLSCYNRYTNTWGAVNQAAEDYAAGWRECEKEMKHEAALARVPADHAEAIKMNKEFKKFGRFPEVLKFRCDYCYKRFTVKWIDGKITCPNCDSDKITLKQKGE